MRHPTRLLTIPLLLLALVACDFISGFVPPIEVGNVLGIGEPDNPTTITAPAFQNPADLGAFKPAAVGAIDYERAGVTFDNIELPDLRGFTLDGLWVTIGLGNTITLERENTTAEYPERFTLTSFEGYVKVSDAQSIREPTDYHFTEKTLNFEFVRAGACASNGSCEYRATAKQSDLNNAMLFQIPERHGRVVKDLVTIASQGGQNTAHIKIRLTADAPNGNLAGFTPTLQISNPSTKVSLGG